MQLRTPVTQTPSVLPPMESTLRRHHLLQSRTKTQLQRCTLPLASEKKQNSRRLAQAAPAVCRGAKITWMRTRAWLRRKPEKAKDIIAMGRDFLQQPLPCSRTGRLQTVPLIQRILPRKWRQNLLRAQAYTSARFAIPDPSPFSLNPKPRKHSVKTFAILRLLMIGWVFNQHTMQCRAFGWCCSSSET